MADHASVSRPCVAADVLEGADLSRGQQLHQIRLGHLEAEADDPVGSEDAGIWSRGAIHWITSLRGRE